MFKKDWVRRKIAKFSLGHKVVGSVPDLYRELDYAKTEIRLLEIQPAEPNRPVKCSLHFAYLQDGPSCAYETISYVWGDTSLRGSVSVNGQYVDVPASTEIVLRRMRRPDCGRTVWIDSLCINQNDDRERSRQVTLMADIYTHTTQNLIWLGEDMEGSGEQSIAALQAILKDMNCEVNGAKELFDLIYGSQNQSQYGRTPIATDVNWSAITRFFESPWFARLWVIQEAALPAKSTCFFGDSHIQMRHVMKAVCWIDYKYHATNTGWERFPKGFMCARDIFHFTDEDCGAFRNRWRRAVPLASQIFYMDGSTDAPTDIRDYVYGRLGLYQKIVGARTLPPDLIPDYSLPFEEVFCRAVRALVMLDHSLVILDDIEMYGNVDESGLPSWVPRWHLVTGKARTRAFTYSCAASREMKINRLTTEVVRSPNVLSVDGVAIGVIVRCSAVFQKYPFSGEKLFDAKRSLFETYDLHQLKSSGGLWCHTLMAGIDYYRTVCDTHRAAELCDAYLNMLQSKPAVQGLEWQLPENATIEEGEAWNWFLALKRACSGRCLFITNTGHFGLGPPDAKIGDIVTILFGGDYPYVLRPIDLQEDSYTYVGTSFISEIMHGEAVDEWEARGDAEETFHLH